MNLTSITIYIIFDFYYSIYFNMAGEYVFYNSCTLNVNEAWNNVNL